MVTDKKSLISAGAELAGAAVGGALGFIATGPGAAAGAAAAGVGFARVLQDVAARVLSRRETIRIGATAAVAIALIKERVENGEKLRSDGFFEAKGEQRSSAEEIFEGTLLAAKNTHEEKKANYLGRLFANVSFNSTCKPDEANYLIHVTESLTYAQFVLLQLFSENGNPYLLRTTTYAKTKFTYSTLSLLQSIRELCDLGLVIMMRGRQSGDYEIVLDLNHIRPADLKLDVSGRRLQTMLGLASIPNQDIKELSAKLQ